MANIQSRPKAYVSFQVRLSPDLKERLVRRSYETRVSQASIVVAALQHYLDTGLTPQENVEETEDGAALEDEEGEQDR